MSAPIDVLADLSILANIGEYRDLRESMEKCLRPHERAGFADLLARMGNNHTAIAELIEAIEATRATRGGIMALAASDARVTRLWAVLARVKGGAA